MIFFLYIFFSFAIIKMALLCGLEGAPTFLVPIINPPFADTARPFFFWRNMMPSPDKLAQRYQRIHRQLQDLLTKCNEPVARMSTVIALLHHKFPHYFWTGFYLLKKGDLLVGPYQGPVACQVLEREKGVCWAGVLKEETIVVPDVHKFPGHIACDGRSKSEIVVPLFAADGTVKGVLDVDSTQLNAFSAVDKLWLEKIVALL